jgi:hypothetical protein
MQRSSASKRNESIAASISSICLCGKRRMPALQGGIREHSAIAGLHTSLPDCQMQTGAEAARSLRKAAGPQQIGGMRFSVIRLLSGAGRGLHFGPGGPANSDLANKCDVVTISHS